MAFPNPIDIPVEFINHLRASHLNFTVNTFHYYKAWPKESATWIDEELTREWCDWMDALLVSHWFGVLHYIIAYIICCWGKLGCVMNMQPEHWSVSSTLGDLCVQLIVEVEKHLQIQ